LQIQLNIFIKFKIWCKISPWDGKEVPKRVVVVKEHTFRYVCNFYIDSVS